MEVLFFGRGGVFARLEQALASQDSSHVPRGEKYKLCSDLGNVYNNRGMFPNCIVLSLMTDCCGR